MPSGWSPVGQMNKYFCTNKKTHCICRYERVWDEADYVIPPAENGAFFVTTNVVITPNQTWGKCPEVNLYLSIYLSI